MDAGTLGMIAIDTTLLSDLMNGNDLNTILPLEFGVEKMAFEGDEGDVVAARNTLLSAGSFANTDGGGSPYSAESPYLGDSENSFPITSGSLDLYVHANFYGSEGGDVL